MFRTFNPKANPKMIGIEFTALVDERDDFVDLITQGNQDGSMHADQVEQAAEIILLLANMWLLPFFRQGTQGSCAPEPPVSSDHAGPGHPPAGPEILRPAGILQHRRQRQQRGKD